MRIVPFKWANTCKQSLPAVVLIGMAQNCILLVKRLFVGPEKLRYYQCNCVISMICMGYNLLLTL